MQCKNASKIAVCIAGTLRTFLKPSVQRSFRDHVHHNGFEYFLSTDFQPDPKEQQAKLLLEPIRAWVANGESTYLDAGRPNSPRRDELPRGRCPVQGISWQSAHDWRRIAVGRASGMRTGRGWPCVAWRTKGATACCWSWVGATPCSCCPTPRGSPADEHVTVTATDRA